MNNYPCRSCLIVPVCDKANCKKLSSIVFKSTEYRFTVGKNKCHYCGSKLVLNKFDSTIDCSLCRAKYGLDFVDFHRRNADG